MQLYKIYNTVLLLWIQIILVANGAISDSVSQDEESQTGNYS